MRELPAPEGFQWVARFLMSGTDPWDGKLTSISDVVSVDVHPSGLWAVVDMGDTVAWVRIPADAHTVEFQRQHELREVKQHRQASVARLRSKILNALRLRRSRHG